jgi:xylan 1,4-beta-xylosidase
MFLVKLYEDSNIVRDQTQKTHKHKHQSHTNLNHISLESMWRSLLLIQLILLQWLCTCMTLGNASPDFHVQLNNLTKFEHYWERCVGSGHAALGQRQDWREQLLRARRELGIQRVRFHGLLNQDMSVLLQDRDGKLFYSFYNVDYLFDYLLSIDMKPLVELSYMPDLLASGTQTLFHYKANVTPPKSYQMWYDLIYHLVKHLVDRYGLQEIRTWHFEVWNEPNNEAFWSGTQLQYFQLYNTTAKAIKDVDQMLKVGGPATMQSLWIDDFISFCQKNNVPFDFISTHEYPTDFLPLSRENLKIAISKTRDIVNKQVSPGFPVFYTEWNSGLIEGGDGSQFYQDSSYAAAFIVKNIADMYGIVDIFSYWTFSDVFEEHGMKSQPFNGQFGMMTVYGIPKPVWRAFELLHKSGDKRAQVQPLTHSNSSTVDVLAVVSLTKKELMLFVSNYDVPINKNKEYDIEIKVSQSNTIKIAPKNAILQRIDERNANAFHLWKEMGEPEYPTKEQISKLNKASELQSDSISFTFNEQNQAVFQLHIPPYSLSVITIALE